ncbi:MAG TPA: hypothetical protein VK348_03705 [Planctomycetota bacterium]|nr:hypothetical protein [Planctomycetota bacterium]
MHHERAVTRRLFLGRSGAAAALLVSARTSRLAVTGQEPAAAQGLNAEITRIIERITDPEIRAGVTAAVAKNLLPAAVEQAYPGHFNICADGGGYGDWATWPGLDSWQMAGAYLLLGNTRLVLDYFDYVGAAQRPDGNIPFAIFKGSTRADGTYLCGLKHPQDVFTYTPSVRAGLPASSQEPRQWIGLFGHWQPKAEPLSTLGPVCHVLTAAEIFDATKDTKWLAKQLPSVEKAAKYLSSRTSPNGLVAHSGFYLELPPRRGWDGVAQCYVVHAYRELARLFRQAGNDGAARQWTAKADQLARTFVTTFWRDDHFAEYVHEEHGLVDAHGLTDTNWAAVAFGVAEEQQLKKLWPLLLKEQGFWWGGMPTLPATRPFSYEQWELHETVPMAVPPLLDMSSMGRVWYLEAMACQRQQAWDRLLESTRRVCRAAKDGHWRERYQPQADGTTVPARSEKYCEYPAVLLRVVLGNLDTFCKKQ